MKSTQSTGTRIGLVGPASGKSAELERALASMLGDPAMREIVYLGDDSSVDDANPSLEQGRIDQDEFLTKAVELACTDADDAIFELLAASRASNRLASIRRLPEAPARAIEMMDKWIVLFVYDKSVLDEDDIANAHVIVYGRADEASVKRFGPRCFFTPGPIAGSKVGCLELMPDGQLQVKLLDLSGETLACETLAATGGKVVVTG